MPIQKRIYQWFLVIIILSTVVLLALLNMSTITVTHPHVSILTYVRTDIPPAHSARTIARPRVEAVSCRKLFMKDEGEKKRAEALMNSLSLPGSLTDNAFIFPVSECTRFVNGRGYTMDSMTEEEANFPLAFSIVMFKDVARAERLLRAIYRPQNHYCLHIDRKSSWVVRRAMQAIADCFPNVFIASRLFNVRWGELSVVDAEMQCMRDLLIYKKWKYFINLTGQEFPLKTNWQLVKILKVLNGANDMEGTLERRNAERTMFVHKGLRRTSRRKRPPPHNVRLTKGSVHITASRAFVDFLINDRKAKDFYKWVKNTGIPDETFFSSLHHSPHIGVPGSYTGSPETDPIHRPFITRFKNWGAHPFDWPCAGKRVRMVCVFGVGDLPLLASRPEFFANKFYNDYQPLAYDCLEELHFNKTREEYAGILVFNTSFYEKLPIVYKKSRL